jgi:hypothetical protein
MELTDMELEQLKLADNEESWNNLVDQIKEKRGGSYPPDWYEKVIKGDLKLKVNLKMNILNI